MGKKGRRKDRIPQPSSTPLFIVAGLPKATDALVEQALSEALSGRASVVHAPAVVNDGPLYRADYVDRLIMSSARFATKRRTDEATVTAPASVHLLYVPTSDQELLLQAFDFAAFPVELSALGTWGERGRMLRHDVEAVQNALKLAAASTSPSLEPVLERVKTARRKDGILLPPKNFHISKAERMERLLREMRAGTRPWTDRFGELEPKEFDHERLPKLGKKEKLYCFQDARELVFKQAHPTAYHGEKWAIEDDDAKRAADALRALYRFGAPLPQGFQHDAQFEYGKELSAIEFDCADQGTTPISGTHANVYANDYVRAGKD